MKKSTHININLKYGDAQIIEAILEKFVGEGYNTNLNVEKILNRFSKQIQSKKKHIELFFGK